MDLRPTLFGNLDSSIFRTGIRYYNQICIFSGFTKSFYVFLFVQCNCIYSNFHLRERASINILVCPICTIVGQYLTCCYSRCVHIV